MPNDEQRRPVIGKTYICTIERILPFGVFVRLEDGATGYIRRREMSLSGDAEGLSQFEVGQTIKAVVIEPAGPSRSMELSVRRILPDPWQEFVRVYGAGSEAKGVVKNLTDGGAYVEILPGVQGFVPVDELAPWKVSTPSDVVWPGDCVCARVTAIDVTQHRIRLSLRRYLENITLVQTVLDTVRGTATRTAEEPPIPDDVPQGSELEPVRLDAPVLVVEDTKEIREPLVRWLREKGCEAQEADSSNAALQLCSSCPFALVIADLDLPGLDGVGLIRQLRQNNLAVPIAIMSDPDFIREKLPELAGHDISAVFTKPLERDMRDVHELLVRLTRRERPVLRITQTELETPRDVTSFEQTARSVRVNRPVEERLQQSLEQIVRSTGATTGMIFRLDPSSRQISIVASSGFAAVSSDALYGLLESPVRDVIEEEIAILENHVTRDQYPRFRKLLDLLTFESCIAIPLSVAGRTEHALFLFQPNEGAFSVYRQRDALATAVLLAAILENQALDDRLKSVSGILLSGQLAAGLGHEIHNRLTGLDLQFLNLQQDVARVVREHADVAEAYGLIAIQTALEQARSVSEDLRRTVREYRRLMETRGERIVDVNHEIRQAELLLRPLARRAKVELRLNLGDNLPTVVGSNLGLQQVFLNLMLNAVQHTELKKHDYRVVTVTTACQSEDGDTHVAVRCKDTGPGIHRQHWDKVFALGFSTRQGGSGLGLFIAQSLLNTMGGRLSIESSTVLVGTTFLVELPVVARGERKTS